MIEGISALAVPIRPNGSEAKAAVALNLTSARLTAPWKATLLKLIREEVGAIEEQLAVRPSSLSRG